MSCRSIYVVREPDGTVWYDTEKYGRMRFSSPIDLLADLALRRRRPIARAADDVWCEGWYVDRGAKRARFCFCRARDEASVLAAMRGDAAWAGWDIAIAHEKTHDLRTFAALPEVADDHASMLDSWPDAAEPITQSADPRRFPHRWDAAREELRYEFYYNDRLALRVIDAAGRVRDHGFDAWGSATIAALGRGPALLAELRELAPCPSGEGEYGALIDEQRREISIWGVDPIAPATFAKLRAHWPGWQVAREADGLAGIEQRCADRALRQITAILVEPTAEPPPSAEAAALLAAIHGERDSDAPRRVYADLLLARGDDRGALIQIQSELALLAARDERSPHRRALEAEELRLLRGCFHGVPGGAIARFSRGFPQAVQSSVDALIESRVLERMPTVDELVLYEPLDSRAASRLLAAPGYAQLRALDIGRLVDALRVLARGPAGQLRRLRIAAGEASQLRALREVLREPGAFAALESLTLHGSMLDNDELGRMLGALAFPALRTLVIDSAPNPRLDARPFAALARNRSLETVVELRVGQLLEDDASAPLIAHLGLGNVRTLALTGSRQRCDPARLVAAFPALRHLVLGGFEVELAALAESPELRRLRTLELGDTVTAAGITALARSPHAELDELILHTPQVPAELAARFGERLVVRR